MKPATHLFIAYLSAFAGAASADPFYVHMPAPGNPFAAAQPVDSEAQAQLMAERHIWRISGMHQLNARQRTTESDPNYKRAKAKYDALIASPQFPLLVDALAGNQGLEVRVR